MDHGKKETLIETLIEYIEQAQRYICVFRESDYNRGYKQNSSVGSHLRHCYEFVHLFCENLEKGRINYDRRKRDKEFEIDPIEASKKLESLKIKLSTIKDQHIEPYIFVAESCELTGDEVHFVSSTIDRELLFLISHMVHHFGIIRLLCQMIDIYLPGDFGKASSTIIYEKQAKAA